MATDKYPEHKALNPFFDVIMKGLRGLVDGEHYYDAIAATPSSSSYIASPVGRK